MTPSTAVLEALPVAVYLTDAEGHITFYNQCAAELWGQRPALGTKWCGSARIYLPDGQLLPHDECPMAICIREQRPVRGVDAVVERPDGTRVPFLPYPTPLRDESGKMIGAINVMIDISDWKHAQTRLAAIITNSDDAIISKTLEATVTSWNAGATRIFGYTPGEMIGQSILRLIPPELRSEEDEIIARLKRGERIDHYETVRVTKDGRRLDVSLTVSPLRDASGNVVGASKIARDITEKKQAEKLQGLLLDELNHRVKNTLAIVQSIANQSLERTKNPVDFVRSFSGRIQALAKAHGLLTQTRMQGAEMSDLAREQVMLGTADDRRITTEGPKIVLDAQAAVHLALVLHELATNARKFGALSGPGGRLKLSWSLQTGAERNLHLAWEETGGPRVTAPTSRGFGTTLIEQTMRAHGGEASITYAAGGVVCRITLPLPEMIEDQRPKLPEPDRLPSVAPHDYQSSLLRGRRILIVEDEPIVAMELESTLSDRGCSVLGPTGSIEEATALLEKSGCDAALLDVNLGGRSIDDLAATLTKKNIPFAFVTGYGRRALPEAFQEAVILSKPFTQDQLLAVVEVLLYLGRPPADIIQMRRKLT